jgi:A/G-specific adenine glycosylase
VPWQHDINPYRVWLSETMLQQTQVITVIPYFNAFIARFPTLESLAAAPVDDVLQYWSGLGYYARARNLHKTAQRVVELGYFPDTLEELLILSGIGLSTAGAILSIAFQKSHPILDGNVRRVLARFHAIHGWTGSSHVNKTLWAISSQLTPIQRVADYTQAMMDLGATVCTRSKPACPVCPLKSDCQALLTDTTSLLPTPKAAKAIPVKQVVFLVLRNCFEQILLEKRPPTGIWGGLWSVPEFTSNEEAVDWCVSHDIAIVTQQTRLTQRHTFSHYHLDYTPLLIQTNNPINSVMEAKHIVWYNAGQIKHLGLAAPIKRLLQQHDSQQE